MTRRLKYHLSALSALLVLAVIAYFDTFRSMVDVYLRSDTFVHGFIILPISIFLVWRRWSLLESIAPRTFLPGIALLLAISSFWFLSDILGIQVGKHFAVTAIIPAAVVTIMGVSFARSITFPLAFLLFAVPFGEFWVPHLQEITADFAVGFLRLTGIPVLREGLYLVTPTGFFEVAEACSGIRYILAALSLGTLFAYLSYQKTYKRLIFIVFSLVLPIVANGIRAYGIIAIAHYSNMKYAVGIDHLIYGWLFFGVVIGLMFIVGNRYRDSDSPSHDSASSGGRGSAGAPTLRAFVFTVSVAAIATMSGPFSSYALATRSDQQIDQVYGLPGNVAGWQGSVLLEPQWQPSFRGATHESSVRYRGPDTQVDVAVIRYSGRQQGSELANVMNSISGDDGWRRLGTREVTVKLADGTSVQLLETSAEKRGLVRLFWYWYDIDGSVALSGPRIKLLEAKNLISGRSGISSAVIISAVDEEHTQDVLRAFLPQAFDAISACLTEVGPENDCELDLQIVEPG